MRIAQILQRLLLPFLWSMWDLNKHNLIKYFNQPVTGFLTSMFNISLFYIIDIPKEFDCTAFLCLFCFLNVHVFVFFHLKLWEEDLFSSNCVVITFQQESALHKEKLISLMILVYRLDSTSGMVTCIKMNLRQFMLLQ